MSIPHFVNNQVNSFKSQQKQIILFVGRILDKSLIIFYNIDHVHIYMVKSLIKDHINIF